MGTRYAPTTSGFLLDWELLELIEQRVARWFEVRGKPGRIRSDDAKSHRTKRERGAARPLEDVTPECVIVDQVLEEGFPGPRRVSSTRVAHAIGRLLDVHLWEREAIEPYDPERDDEVVRRGTKRTRRGATGSVDVPNLIPYDRVDWYLIGPHVPKYKGRGLLGVQLREGFKTELQSRRVLWTPESDVEFLNHVRRPRCIGRTRQNTQCEQRAMAGFEVCFNHSSWRETVGTGEY